MLQSGEIASDHREDGKGIGYNAKGVEDSKKARMT
jgi:hypothetical protein